METVSDKNTGQSVRMVNLSTNFCLDFLGIMNWSLSKERKNASPNSHAPIPIVP